MNDTFVISIITPAFQATDKLMASMASLRDQETGSVEHIIVDGSECRETQQLVTEWRPMESNAVVYVGEPDKGPYDAMNKGVLLSRGRYLYFLGAGDVLLPGALQTVVNKLPANLLSMLYGNVMMGEKIYDGRFTKEKLCFRNICHQAIFYGREIFNALGPFSLLYRSYADWEFNMRCFGNDNILKIHIDNEIAIYEGGGLSTHGDKRFSHDACRLIVRHLGWTVLLRFFQRRATNAFLKYTTLSSKSKKVVEKS